MRLIIDHPDFDRCMRCRSMLDKAGYRVEVEPGKRHFLCELHLGELLRDGLSPVKAVVREM